MCPVRCSQLEEHLTLRFIEKGLFLVVKNDDGKQSHFQHDFIIFVRPRQGFWRFDSHFVFFFFFNFYGGELHEA